MTLQTNATVDAISPGQRERWPVIRTGERQPIPGHVRRLVYLRDAHRCVFCGSTGPLELDHVMPWSAGGPDTSDNLRTLCSRCNADRSNFRDQFEPRILPVTALCDPCWHRDAHRYDPDSEYGDSLVDLDGPSYAAFCGRCELTSWVSDPRSLL